MRTRAAALALVTLLGLPAAAQPGDYSARDVAGPARVDVSSPPDFRGVLDDDDPLREGKPYDTFTFEPGEGTEVTVTMTAADFDTYLVVRAPDGQEWTNDDFGDTRTSQVSFTPTARGTYTVLATAYSTDGRGAYEVRVRSVAATVVSTAAGRLDYQDARQIKGEFYDEFAVRPPADGEFYVDLLPLGFSGYLRVTSPSGVHTFGQQQGSPETPVRVGPFRGERGTWTVAVTTQAPGEVGAYDVRVITLDESQ